MTGCGVFRGDDVKTYRNRISELEAENEQLLKRIEHLALEVRGLLDVNAEYKRQAIKYSNEIDRLEEYIEELRFNQPL